MSKNILCDTHILLWALLKTSKLPTKAKELLTDADNKIFYSSVSIWEVAIKFLKKPDKIDNISPEKLVELCDGSGFTELRLRARHVLQLQTLSRPDDAPPHNDPFDRILLAQAKAEDMTFLTHDSLIAAYNDPCIICA